MVEKILEVIYHSQGKYYIVNIKNRTGRISNDICM